MTTTPKPWFRRLARLWGFALFVLLIGVLFRHILLPFVFACLVTYILAPAINRMSSWKVGGRSMPRGAAVILCYIVVLGVLGVFLGAFLPRVSGDFVRLAREAPQLWERIDKEWTPKAARVVEDWFPSLAPQPEEATNDSDPTVVSVLPSPPGTLFTVTPMVTGEYAVTVPADGVEIQTLADGRLLLSPREKKPPRSMEELIRDRFKQGLSGMEGQAASIIRFGRALVTGVLGIIMKLVLALMVAAFMLIDLGRIHSFARGLIPKNFRDDYDLVVAGIDRGLSGVIRGQLVICLVNGILTYIGLVIFGVKYALLLAAIAGLMSLIPIFGSILSSIPIVVIAMVSGKEGVDVTSGIYMLAWILAIHFLEANLLNPKIIGTAAKMHPVLVIFALIAGEHTYGLTGALFAVPVASIIQTLFVFFRNRAWKTEVASTPSAPPATT